MSQGSTVVLVGHCGPDSFMLRTAVGRVLPESSIIMVNDAASLEEHLSSNRILLVNRVLDGSFATGNGVDLIRDIAGTADGPRCLLISNYDDAQEDAVAAGALPGFGKSEIYSDKATECLRAASIGSCGEASSS